MRRHILSFGDILSREGPLRMEFWRTQGEASLLHFSRREQERSEAVVANRDAKLSA